MSDANNILKTAKVTFLSNGKIIEIEKDVGFDIDNDGFDLFPLKSGGFIIAIARSTNYGCNISAHLLNSNYNFNIIIDTYLLCMDIVYDNLHNNTSLVVQDIKENYWTLLTVDLPEVMIGNYLIIAIFLTF